ncbi:unnamed protein product [Adineta steineri]|uniref:NHL repeat containing protein-like protein n=1 Tax=Adineta steineri TaxID=433720 RepID=A0A813W457_9BILA|nr:unnamed protein product [Adineta steineri]
MPDRYLKYLLLKSIIVIAFLIDKISTLSICPTAVWSSTGKTVAGSSTGTAGTTLIRLDTPVAVIVDNNSNFYVADSGNYRVLLFPSNSTIGRMIINGSSGTGLNQFMEIDDIYIDANGNIYVLDGTLSRVTKWTPGSTSGIIVAGGPFIDYFDGHMDIMGEVGRMFIEPQSSFIWIADSDNNRIVKWINSSTALTVCGSYGTNSDQFNFPAALFVDTVAGNTLYVVDCWNQRIQMWLPGATSGLTVAGITSYYGTRLDQLWNPIAIVVDSNRNMFIVDFSNSRILKWKVGAIFGVNIAGTEPNGGISSSQLNTPGSISFSSNGTLYVADTYNNRIQRFTISCLPISTSNCAIITWAFNATTIAGSPIGLTGFTATLLNNSEDAYIGSNDSIYVIDCGAYCRVQIFYPGNREGVTIINGTFGTGLNQFYNMDGISVDQSGNVYILDAFSNRITKWAPGASTGILVAGGNGLGISLKQLSTPYGFFVEPNTSYIWIADTDNCRIVKWMNASTGVLVAGGSCGTKANQFNSPNGLFIDTSASNTLYVADTNNNRIQKFLYGTSNGTTVVGQSRVAGSALNQLNSPVALVVDTSGSLYIVDYGNNRIVLWSLGSTSGRVIAGSDTFGVLPSQLFLPYTIRLDSTGALIVIDTGNSRIQRFPVLCSPNITASSATSIATTFQNTTIAVLLTTNSLTASAILNNSTTILSALTPIAGSITGSAADTTTGSVTGSTTSSVTGSAAGATTGSITESFASSATRSVAGSVTESATGSTTESVTGLVTGSITGLATSSVAGSTADATTGSAAGSVTSSVAGATTGSVTGSATGSATSSVAGSTAGTTIGSAIGSVTSSITGSATSSVAGSAAGSGTVSAADSTSGSATGSTIGSVTASAPGSVPASTAGSITRSVTGPTTGSATASASGSTTVSVTALAASSTTSTVIGPATSSAAGSITESVTDSTTESATGPATVSTAGPVTDHVTGLAAGTTTGSATESVTASTIVSTLAGVTPSTTGSISAMAMTSENNSSTNGITQISSTMTSHFQPSSHSCATRNLNSKLLIFLFCAIIIFMNK